jgi:hypothetical protein
MLILSSLSLFLLAGCGKTEQEEVEQLEAKVKAIADGQMNLEKNLTTLDTLDYNVFSNQELVRLHESHSQDIKVNWPDGHYTTGIERHIEDLKALFVYAPDTRIKQHPIRFGDSSREWTCVYWCF